MSFHFPKAVLFDWDNTLVDTELSTFHALNVIFRKFGKEQMTFEEFAKKPATSVRSSFKEIFSPDQYMEAEKFYALHSESLTSHVKPFLDAEPLLKWLKLHNILAGVVSNKEGNCLRKEISHLKWDHYFYCAIGSYDTAEDKPSSVPLLHALSQKSLTAGPNIWFVGDSIVDMICAHQSNCLPVSIGRQAEIHGKPGIKAKDRQHIYDILHNLHKKETPCTVCNL